MIELFENFYSGVGFENTWKQLKVWEGIDEMIESIVSGKGRAEYHNWNR